MARGRRAENHDVWGLKMKYVLLWMLGIPIPILLILWLFFR